MRLEVTALRPSRMADSALLDVLRPGRGADRARGAKAPKNPLYRLARVITHANRVFEDPDESAGWIHTPNTSLGKQQPLTLLDTDIGVQQVDQVLGRIEHGIVG
jgi:putative toxin-antitoxin system antitoxin component (TIGR02293 family)